MPPVSFVKHYSDAIMPAYQKPFGGVNPKWLFIRDVFVKTNLSR
jgi:hypothetical protein